MATTSVTVLAPAFYPSLSLAHSTRYLRLSAERYGVPVRWYGEDEPYRGWLDVQLKRLLAELRNVHTPLMLYTDSSDALFLAGLDEIERRYASLGSPELLMSVEADGQVCAGGWMGQVREAIDTLEWLEHWSFDGDESNPQIRWREAIEDGEIEVTRDEGRRVFQVADEKLIAGAQERGIWNPRTDSWPCLLHWAGGYTDPQMGKAALIEPVWKELGYAPSV